MPPANKRVIQGDEGERDEDRDLPEPREDDEETLVQTDREELPPGEYVSLEHEPAGDGKDGEGGDVEERRARRRAERKRQKQRDREYRSGLETTVRQQAAHIAELSGRISNVETHARAGGVREIDTAIANADTVIAQMNQAVTDGIKAQNGQLVAEAQERLFDARMAKRDLEAMKARTARPAPDRAPAMDPSVTAMSQAWAARNRWYKPGTNDEDTAIATTVDALVNSSGLDPRTSEYWDELDRRLAKRLPHRYKNRRNEDDDDGEGDDEEDLDPRPQNGDGRRRIPRSGGSGSGGRPSGGGERFFLSAARVAAMKEDGSWDDPEKKKRRIEYYKRYDAEHQRG